MRYVAGGLIPVTTQPPHDDPSLECMMSEHDQKNDPWANLAESLGAKPAATPAAEPAPRPAAATPPPPCSPAAETA